jgi:Leucine-rich repeat (LRR) protein
MKILLSLTLNDNTTKQLPQAIFQHQQRLIYLDLADNQIETLCYLAFQGLTNVKSIQLQRNNLMSIGTGFLSDAKRLTTLQLGMKEQDISPGAFEGLEQFDIPHSGS